MNITSSTLYITCEDSIVLEIVLDNMERCRDEPCEAEVEAEVEVIREGVVGVAGVANISLVWTCCRVS